MSNLPSVIQSLRRLAWRPQVVAGDRGLAASKFAGTPWLHADEAYPICPNCNQPMRFFLQLNLQELPEPVRGAFGEGLLQMFYCTSSDPLCECDCSAWEPFAASTLLRLVQPADLENAVQESVQLPELEDPFPAKTIVGWEAMDDFPNPEEQHTLGVELTEAETELLGQQDYPHPGDKLAGYPLWIQGIEYPNCPICHTQMQLVFQIDSEDNLPYMFGDVGCGHITQCPTHKTQVAFGWACG